jgi:hypothetical protein
LIAARAARAGLEAREQQLQRELAAQRSNAEAATPAQPGEPLAQPRAGAATRQPGAGTVIASFVLLPPARGPGDIPTVAISPGTEAVTLHVDLESDDFPTYRAALKDPRTARTIWGGANLRAAPRDGARSLPITLDASLLKPQTYTVDVTGVPARGTPVSVGSYPFTVVVK